MAISAGPASSLSYTQHSTYPSETQNAAFLTQEMAKDNLQDIESKKAQNSSCRMKDPEEVEYTLSEPRSLKMTEENEDNYELSDPQSYEMTEEIGLGSTEIILTQVTDEDGKSDEQLSPIYVHTNEDGEQISTLESTNLKEQKLMEGPK